MEQDKDIGRRFVSFVCVDVWPVYGAYAKSNNYRWHTHNHNNFDHVIFILCISIIISPAGADINHSI